MIHRAGPRTDDASEFGFTLPRATPAAKARAAEIYADLLARYPDAHCELDHDPKRPHQLLVATILSAQATDVGVNKATPALFRAFPTPAVFAAATPEEIEPHIRTIGLFRNKAKAVHAAMKAVVENFAGEVPRTMEELLTLRGVARKTANVVLGNAFGVNTGVVVDTHVERLSKRFSLAPQSATTAMVERHLMARFPRENWCMLSHLLIFHGRRACKARGGACQIDAICMKWCREARASA
jgi:endonuclease-3